MITQYIVGFDNGYMPNMHYLNQLWFSLLTHIYVFWPQWVIVAGWHDWASKSPHTDLNKMHFKNHSAVNTYIYATIQTILSLMGKLTKKSYYRFIDIKSHLCSASNDAGEKKKKTWVNK